MSGGATGAGLPTPENDYERNLLRHIEAFGCSVTSVFDRDGDAPPFTYSIGIPHDCGAPELIIVGLEAKVAHGLVNDYHRRCRDGERFAPGMHDDGFLAGYAVRFGAVAAAHRAAYLRSACWLHDGPGFEALQLIWPSEDGRWPGDADAPDWLPARQPLLDEDPA